MTKAFLRLGDCRRGKRKITCIWVFIKCLKKCSKAMVRAGAFDECMMHCGCIYIHPLHKWDCDELDINEL